MSEIECSMVVRRDPATLFDYVSRPGRRAVWQSNLLRRDQSTTSQDRSSWIEIRRLGARHLRVEVTMTESVRPSRITYIGHSIGIRSDGEIAFHPHASGTLIVHRVQLRGGGLSSMITPLVARRVRQILQMDLLRLSMRFAEVAA